MKLATLPDSVQSLFDAMIVELTTAYAAQGSGITIPANQFIAPGIIAWDDEFAAIQLQDIDVGTPGSPAGPPPPLPTPLTFYGVWAFTILRHVHIGQDGLPGGPIIPTPAEVNTDGVQSMADASALTIASIAVWQDATNGNLPLVSSPGQPWEISKIQTVGPNGGFAGVYVTFAIPLDLAVSSRPGNIRVMVNRQALGRAMREQVGARYLLETQTAKFILAAKRDCPRRTGTLARTIVRRPEFSETRFTVRVLAGGRDAPYGLFVHEGTQPHVIQSANVLRFFWPNGPNGPGIYFFASVNHPGTEPHPFLRKNLPIFLSPIAA